MLWQWPPRPGQDAQRTAPGRHQLIADGTTTKPSPQAIGTTRPLAARRGLKREAPSTPAASWEPIRPTSPGIPGIGLCPLERVDGLLDHSPIAKERPDPTSFVLGYAHDGGTACDGVAVLADCGRKNTTP
jgi:hypothetical protein